MRLSFSDLFEDFLRNSKVRAVRKVRAVVAIRTVPNTIRIVQNSLEKKGTYL